MLQIETGENNPLLRKVAAPVTAFDETLEKLVKAMAETMLAPDPETGVTGIGLAAPQVAVNQRVILITLNVGSKKELRVLPMINPEIVEYSPQETILEEGCLSLPGIFERISRPAKIRVRWQTLGGEWAEKRFGGWEAREIQHEVDHLEGILFIDPPEVLKKQRNCVQSR